MLSDNIKKALLEWRENEANKSSKTQEILLPANDIEQISKQAPVSRKDLLSAVSRPAIINKYGEDLLKIILKSIYQNDSYNIPKNIRKEFSELPDISSSQEELAFSLCAWRNETKRKLNCQYYGSIINNLTIVNISLAHPTDEKSLLKVKGIGAKKMEDFGDDILNIVKLFPLENHQVPYITERKLNDSEEQTIELYNNGKNPDEIANIHNPKLSVSTIWKHIAKGVSLNFIPANKFLSNEGYVEIESAIKKYIKENYILDRLKPIYESLESKYHYEQIKYAIYIFAKKVQYSNGMVELHPFIDGWLQSRGAYYENDPKAVQDGTRLNENGVKWYLGSIFPKSFAESYSIYYDLLSNTKYNEKLSIHKSIKILDIGGGTGGNVAGIILAIISKLPNIQEISIDAYDPCAESRNAYTDLIKYIDKILKYSGYIHINLECKHLMLQPEFDEPQNGSYTFSNFSTHLAESKKSYDLIMSFKMINELIKNGGFNREQPYFNFLNYLCPLLNENGVLILEDVSGDNGVYYCKQLNNETRSYLESQNNFKVLAPIPCAIKQQDCKYQNCFMQQQVKAKWRTAQFAHMTSRFSYKIMSFANTCQDIVPTQFQHRYKKVYMDNANNDNNNDHWCYPKDVDMNLPEKDAFKIGDLDYGREDNNN